MSQDKVVITVETEEVEVSVEPIQDVSLIVKPTPDVLILSSGNMGPQGTPGDRGLEGTPGEQWFSGFGTPAISIGIIGDWYLNSANGDYYEKQPSILDDFNRADEIPITTGWHQWVSDPTLKLVSNQLAGNAPGDYGGAIFNTSMPADVEAYIEFANTPVGWVGVMARLDPIEVGTSWNAWYEATSSEVILYCHQEIVAQKTIPALGAGDGIGIRCKGSLIQLWVLDNGVWAPALSVDDIRIPGTGLHDKLFIYIEGTTTRLDNFRGGSVPGVGAWTLRGSLKGPTGATGSQGIQGPQGTTGATGATGQAEAWHSGAGAPATGLGVVGDWYLNTTNSDVYEKTGTSVWTLRTNIKGATGTTGSQGIQGIQGPQGNTGATGQAEAWYSGAGAPPGATGVVGDWYLDTTTGDVHEKTGAAAWTLRANIKGATGSTGSTGAAGEKWFSGAGAPAGGTGAVGDWYLDTTAGDVYEKTGGSTWTLRMNIKGPAGTTGGKWFTAAGVPAGGTGAIGDFYINSTNGDYYEKTGASTWTLRGNLKGPTGNTGATGAAEAWYSGSGAPPGATGVIGDWYLDTATGDVHEKTGASAWTLRANIKGPTGAQGIPGTATLPPRLDVKSSQITDWNNATQNGWYSANNGTNGPPGLGGWLIAEVVSYSDVSVKYITQRAWNFTSFNRSIGWERRCINDVWYAWAPIATAGVCATTTDWNNAIQNGWWMASSAANAPSALTGWVMGEVIVHRDASPLYVVQRVWDFTAPAGSPVYERRCNNDVWGSWVIADNMIIDAKGDLIVGTADNTPVRKAVGSNGTYLKADSTQTDGLIWAELMGIDEFTMLCVHADGVDGATAFTDSALTPHKVTALGAAQVDTAQSKFGGASALFGGATDCLQIADASDLVFGTGDFTIDFWIRFSSIPGSTWVAHKSNGGYGEYGFYLNANGTMGFYASSTTAGWDIANSWSCGSFVINQWYHIAVSRQGSTWRIFKDGVLQSTNTSALSVVDTGFSHNWGGYGSGASIMGWMDEIRISKGIARWTANFTPPSSSYTAPLLPGRLGRESVLITDWNNAIESGSYYGGGAANGPPVTSTSWFVGEVVTAGISPLYCTQRAWEYLSNEMIIWERKCISNSWQPWIATAIRPAIIDVKGDIIVGTADNTPARKAAGANDSVLTSDSAQADGLKWVKVGDAMVLAGSNLAKLSAVTGTPTGTKFLRDDGSWQLPAVGITAGEDVLGADVAMASQSVYYDGASVTLAVGTYILLAQILCFKTGGNTVVYVAKLWNGTAVEASGEAGHPSSGGACSIALSGIVTVPSGTETWKISAAGSVTNCAIKAAASIAGNPAAGTRIAWVKIA